MQNSFSLAQLWTSLRLVCLTMVVCSVLYPALILGLGMLFVPDSAQGSLIHDDQGTVIGSKLLAQRFSLPKYFWSRPSAVDYHAAAAGGSNLSPTNPALRERAQILIARYGADVGNPIPAELLTTSGSGLDPDIGLAAARFQVPRVAAARGLPHEAVEQVLARFVYLPGGWFSPQPLVNVLAVNMALDDLELR